VVTGSDGPLGRGIARALTDAGARVAGFAEAWDSREAARAAFADAARELGPVGVVVHAAMPALAFEPLDFVDVDDARFEAIWEGAMQSTIFVLQAAFPHLRTAAGRVILIAPTVSMSGAARLAPYTTAVEAQRVLMKAVARQWGADGITLNVIATAPEHVPIGVGSTAVSLAPPAFGGPGDVVDDLGPIAVFLASEAAHFVTGATVSADGGIWMAP
jgi:NAD(P)-dependent dehydrogenase (short-subunit alcohol dehydrogenase family)